jgi:hypothetical protein
MKTKFLVLVLGIAVHVSYVSAQVNPSTGTQINPTAPAEGTAILEFENTSHDFGTVNEGGPITYEFKFTNKGKVPLTISMVRASCGCTTPSWTNESVAPGKSGTITAQYNTQNRPGPFNKTLTVTANTEPAMSVLTITGNVLPKVKTPEELYPRKFGNVRMNSEFIYLGKISTKEPITREVKFYNDGDQPISFSTHELPAYLEIAITPQVVEPKKETTVKITYNAAKRNELGPVEDKAVIITNEPTENKKVLNIVADINEYYPPLSSEEAANAPKVLFDKNILDLGTVKPNSSVSQEVEISNPGKQDLVLKKIRSAASYITVKADKTVIKPGHTAKIKVTYKADGKVSNDTQYIWIYSNDPARPTQNFTVKASVSQTDTK